MMKTLALLSCVVTFEVWGCFVFGRGCYKRKASSASDETFDTIIVGGGIAGLSAAAHLVKNGHTNIKVIESSPRLGGRVWSIPHNDGDIELGANWVHGNQSDNSLWLYVNSDEYKGEKPTYDNLWLFETASFRRSSGRIIPQETVTEAFGFLEQFLSGGDEEEIELEELANLSLQDAADTAVSEYISLYPSSTEQQKEDFKAAMGGLFGLLEGEAAADLKDMQLSIYLPFANLLDEAGGEFDFLLSGGVQSVIKSLASAIPADAISLNERVVNIDWTDDDKVLVTTERETLTARHVIVTIPLGVLKANHKKLFTPNLDNDKVTSVESLGFGNVAKLFLQWDMPWWERYEMIVTGWSEEERNTQKLPDEWYKSIPGFLDYHRGTENIMWTVVPGDAGDVCDTLPDKEVIEGVTKTLRMFTGNQTIPPPDRMYRQTWSSDPNFLGTYVFPSSTTKIEHLSELAAPLPSSDNPRILIAGEHTAGLYSSTLHGARQSGLQQAQKIIDL